MTDAGSSEGFLYRLSENLFLVCQTVMARRYDPLLWNLMLWTVIEVGVADLWIGRPVSLRRILFLTM